MAKVGSTKRPEDKCNIVINNLIAKMIIHCDKQKILIQVAELLYSSDKMISTEKVVKLLVIFGKLFQVAPPDQRSKYLQGSLFALGGLLKLEAKSYLLTMENMRKEDDPDFELPCQLFNDDSEVEKMEKQRVRKLTA